MYRENGTRCDSERYNRINVDYNNIRVPRTLWNSFRNISKQLLANNRSTRSPIPTYQSYWNYVHEKKLPTANKMDKLIIWAAPKIAKLLLIVLRYFIAFSLNTFYFTGLFLMMCGRPRRALEILIAMPIVSSTKKICMVAQGATGKMKEFSKKHPKMSRVRCWRYFPHRVVRD